MTATIRLPEGTATTSAIAIAALADRATLLAGATGWADLYQALSNAARAEAERSEPDWPTVKALWLLSDACSMMLRSESNNAPFVPMWAMDTARSAMPEDFSPDDLTLFSAVADATDHPVLRARLSDLAWLGAKPRRIADAHRAIDAYTAQQPSGEDWFQCLEGWGRAITLCLQLRKGAADRLEVIEKALESIATAGVPSDDGLGLAAARLLLNRNLSFDQGAVLADLLAARGQAKQAAGNDFWGARSHFDLACAWFQRVGNVERAADMTLSTALSFEAEADHRIALDATQGHLVAASFLEDAIQTLRKIPKELRQSRGIDGHLQRLLHRVTESGEKAVNALPTINGGKTDITEFVRSAEDAVAGRKLLDALLVLAHLHSGADAAAITKTAEQSLRDFPISRMFGSTHMSRDGRAIAKTPGGSMDEASEAHQAKLWETMMRYHGFDIELVCKAQILPALNVILREHVVRRADLAQLMSLSPVVPPERAEQFAKGLWEGFEFDFATATYLLAPQIENLVRWHLKQAKVKTTTVDKEGIENEIGLSNLVEVSEVKEIFGPDLAFELKALFCSALGPNLRNGVAHGLLSANECHSSGAIYAWWWILRLTLRSFWMARRAEAQQDAPTAADAQPD